jgi:hypothetical protein
VDACNICGRRFIMSLLPNRAMDSPIQPQGANPVTKNRNRFENLCVGICHRDLVRYLP